MGTIEKLTDKVIDRTIGTWIYQDKLLVTTNNLDMDEKQKIINISKKVVNKAIYISTFISIMLIMWYFYGKLGHNKFLALILTLSFIQLVYLNINISRLAH